MKRFIERRPVWSLVILIAAAFFLWLVFAIWPDSFEDFLKEDVGGWIGGDFGKQFGRALSRKKVFLSALLDGVTLAALYFLIAAGFTLIFGLMRNVNLAHGSLYLFGGYVGYEFAEWTGYWLLAFPAAFVVSAALGVLLQVLVFRRMEGEDLRQTLVTIGISIVLADVMLWIWGGDFYQILAPSWLSAPVETFLASAQKSSGEIVYLKYSSIRLVILVAAIVLGVAMWLALNRTRVGMLIRAGVDDRDMLSATGIPIQVVFVCVFAFGAGLAGIGGVVGGTFQSLAPGEDTEYLLSSLIVVIVGGMGSIPGAALGALLIGLADTLGAAYFATYAVVFKFLIMVAVLAFRPRGLLGRS